jgi:hypothetical protein
MSQYGSSAIHNNGVSQYSILNLSAIRFLPAFSVLGEGFVARVMGNFASR